LGGCGLVVLELLGAWVQCCCVGQGCRVRESSTAGRVGSAVRWFKVAGRVGQRCCVVQGCRVGGFRAVPVANVVVWPV
jgi:hypothetical protein